MTDGVYIALLGIDGSGKSGVAAAVGEHLAAAGQEIVFAGTEAVLAHARGRDGHPWHALNQLAIEGWRLYLQEPHPSAVVASALLEFTALHLIRSDVIGPALDRGAVVISDSFGFKNVVKTLRQAQCMPGADEKSVDALLGHLRSAMTEPHLQPDVGLLLDADPELAYRWRIAQRGALEPGADLGVAGREGRESFVTFQAALAAEFREAATRWGWSLLPVDGRPQSDTVTAALGYVMAHPRMRGER